MHEYIRTGELLIRPFQEKDAESFERNVLQDATLASFFDGESGEDYIRARLAYRNQPRFYDCVILLGKEEEAIGEINAACIPKGMADIGYVIASPYRSRGYGRAALKAWIGYLFEEGIDVIYGACRKGNSASIALMRHAGMEPCRQVPKKVRMRENEEDLIYFRIGKKTEGKAGKMHA